MITLKLLGLCLVFLGCAGTGLCMSKGVQKELQVTKELYRLVRRIGSDVRCYKRPLPEIYESFDGALPIEFLQLMKRAEIGKAFALLPEDPALRTVCLPFFERVGRCSAEECERLEAACAAELERLIEEKKETVEAKAKVYRSLGLAGGMAAVILLI